MPYITLANGTVVYQPWSCYLGNGLSNISGYNCYVTGTNISSSHAPLTALVYDYNQALPWFWFIIPLLLYVYLLAIYSDSPSRGKFTMVAALVLIISVFLAAGGYSTDAIINIAVFLAALFLAPIFKL